MSNTSIHEYATATADTLSPTEDTSQPVESPKWAFFKRFTLTLGSLSLLAFVTSILSDIIEGRLVFLNSTPLLWSLGLYLFITTTWTYWVVRSYKHVLNMNVWRVPLLLPPLGLANIYLLAPILDHGHPTAQALVSWRAFLLLMAFWGFFATSILISIWALDQREYFESGPRESSSASQPNRQWRAMGAVTAIISLVAGFFTIAHSQGPVHSWSNSSADSTASVDNATTPLSPMTGTLIWNTNLADSTSPYILHPGANGPVISNTDNNTILGFSARDGSLLWEWSIRDHITAHIDAETAKVSPNGRYYAVLTHQEFPYNKHMFTKDNQRTDRIQLLVLDATTGKELWSRPIWEEDLQDGFYSDLPITLTNRVVAIDRKVIDITTGKTLWILPDDAQVVSNIQSKETLLISMNGDYRRNIRPYAENPQSLSCEECSADIFQPVEDISGIRKGKEFTNLFLSDSRTPVSAHGWIALHNQETHTTTLHDLDSGNEIIGPQGIIDSDSDSYLEDYIPAVESISFDLTPLEQQNEEYQNPSNRVLFTPQDKTLSTLPFTRTHFDEQLLPTGRGKELILRFADSDTAPLLELANHWGENTSISKYVLHGLSIDNERPSRPLVHHAIRSHGGWLVLVGGDSEYSSDKPPFASQLLFIK